MTTPQNIPPHLQALDELSQTIRDPGGRIDWQRIEREHPGAVAQATQQGAVPLKKAIDQLGYYRRKGQPKTKTTTHKTPHTIVPWTAEEVTAVQGFARYQFPDGRTDWEKIRSTDAWARLLTRHTEPSSVPTVVTASTPC